MGLRSREDAPKDCHAALRDCSISVKRGFTPAWTRSSHCAHFHPEHMEGRPRDLEVQDRGKLVIGQNELNVKGKQISSAYML